MGIELKSTVFAKAKRILSYAHDAKPLVAMASPPTITEGASAAASTVNSNASGVVSVGKDDARLTYVGTTPVAAGAGYPDNLYNKGAHLTKGAGMDANNWGVAFATDAPAFEFMMKGNRQRYLVYVDGYPVTLGPSPRTKSPAATLLVKVDFGANVLSYSGVDRTDNVSSGSGYAVGDLIVMAGGTNTTPITVKVDSVSSGVVTGVSYVQAGAYTAIATTLTQASTTGSGTGFQFQPRWGATNSTRRMRDILIVLSDNAYFGGINVTAQDTVVARRPIGPQIASFGDSIGAGTFILRAGGQWPEVAARHLGSENSWNYCIGSTGYIATNGGAQPNMLQHIADTANRPLDLIIVGMGINDTGQTTADIQAQVTATYSALIAQDPTRFIFCLGPWQGANSNRTVMLAMEVAIEAGFVAAAGYDSSRHFFIPTVASNWLVPGGSNGKAGTVTGAGNTEFYTSSDGVHLHQEGQDAMGILVAKAVISKLEAITA
jgi:lysophospholipase L1-like esterase